MNTLEFVKIFECKTAVPIGDLETLANQLKGSLIRAEDEAYDQARRL